MGATYTLYHGTFIQLPRHVSPDGKHTLEINTGALWVLNQSGRIEGSDWTVGSDDEDALHRLIERNGWTIVGSSQVNGSADPKKQTVTVVKGGAGRERNGFFFPGFIDTHIHASQYPNAGIFGSSTLLDWLQKYTFPMEKSFGTDSSSDSAPPKAHTVYNRVISRTLSHGTTTAAYYATIHVPATCLLASLCHQRGQRAFIGRVCMDNPAFCPEDYHDESSAESISATQTVIDYVKNLDPKGKLIAPIVTPRFAPTCSCDALAGLGQLAASYTPSLHIQTHISENKSEVALVKELFAGSSYAQVYDDAGLLTPRTILAHAVHLTAEERALVKSRNAKVSHCPASNNALGSGLCPVRTLLDDGIVAGLGTDVSGGYSPSILESARQACLVSRLVTSQSTGTTGRENLSVEEALYLATRGGAHVVDMADQIGGFDKGMFFDAQLIELGPGVGNNDDIRDDLNQDLGNIDLFGWESWEEKIAKWVWSGDDRNVKSVWVAGRLVHQRRYLNSPRSRDLHLAAALGLDADTVLLDTANFHRTLEKTSSQSIPTKYASIPIDHDNHTRGTYENRYWVSTKYYKSGGPVFVYDVGESSAYSTAQSMLSNDSTFVGSLLKEFGGVGIIWEHRYYGKSFPTSPVGVETPIDDFKYLTHHQAIADIPHFANSFNVSDIPYQDLSPKGTPWVMLGGSYSGMRSAFTRNEFPGTIYASYASSAPVQAQLDMGIYFEQVYRGMVGNGYEGCAHDLNAAMRYVDSQLARNGSASNAVKALFLGDGAVQNSDGDFTAALAYMYSTFQWYGMGGGEMGLGSLCDWLEAVPNAPPTPTATVSRAKRSRDLGRRQGNDSMSASPNGTLPTSAPSTGWAPFIGNKAVTERLAAWPQLVPVVNSYTGTDCSKSGSDPGSCDLGARFSDPDGISWMWQYCSQFGFFQQDNIVPNASHALLSVHQTLAYSQEVCSRQFPGAIKSGALPASPAVEEMNKQTGGWTIRPSNTYWSGGEFDPWLTLSPLSTEAFAPNFVTFRTDVPRCNRKTAKRDLFGYVMKNAMHCFDFNMDFEEGAKSRAFFTKALKQWLPCWKSA
ncbi:chlorohydrolase family protein [Talaromyces islandicus]|uniref:Probable guanine deaminase n=1 Tax=Talaromyces islandicus TaxID=28573 RepID=A0A0U1LZD9_TALIS|nr:chlorohydrolase family protein [Talaromyces islandicus]